MMEFIKNGGVGMFPILLLGLVAVATSAHFAWKKDARVRNFLGLSARSLACFGAAALATNVAATLDYVLDRKLSGDARTDALLEGARESLNPVILCAAVLAVVYLLIAVGERRRDAAVALA